MFFSYLRNLNDIIWRVLFQMPFRTTWFILSSVAIILGLLFGLFRWKYKKSPLLPVIEFIVSLSAYYGICRMPVIHLRMHTALSTTAGIILQSDTYLNAFRSTYHTNATSTLSIARILYNLPKDAVTPDPEYLYSQFLKALGQIKGMGPLGMITDTVSWGWIAVFCVTACALQLSLFHKTGKSLFLGWYVLQFACIYIFHYMNKGSLWVWLLLWISETWIGATMSRLSERNKKTELSSVFSSV